MSTDTLFAGLDEIAAPKRVKTASEIAAHIAAGGEWPPRPAKDREADDCRGTLVYAAHGNGEYFPDDWRYEFLANALRDYSEASPESLDDVRAEADIYNGERLHWLSSNLNRAGYVDRAVEEFALEASAGIMELIGYGQAAEKDEVYAAVLGFLRDRAEAQEEAEQEAEAGAE